MEQVIDPNRTRRRLVDGGGANQRREGHPHTRTHTHTHSHTHTSTHTHTHTHSTQTNKKTGHCPPPPPRRADARVPPVPGRRLGDRPRLRPAFPCCGLGRGGGGESHVGPHSGRRGGGGGAGGAGATRAAALDEVSKLSKMFRFLHSSIDPQLATMYTHTQPPQPRRGGPAAAGGRPFAPGPAFGRRRAFL